jgi:hypothetical protein
MLNTLIAALLLTQVIQVAPPTTTPGQIPAPAVRVSGTASREDGQPPQGQVRMLGPGGDYRSPVAADGSFQFPRVPAGTYRLGGGPALATVLTEPIMVVVADKEISGIRYVVPRVSTAGTLRVVTNVDGGGPLPGHQLTFAKTGAPAGTIPLLLMAGSGAADTLYLNAADYQVAVTGLPAGYTVKSMTSGSTNLLEQPLKVGVGETPQVTVLLGVSSPPPWVKVSGRATGVRPTEIVLSSPNGTGVSQSTTPRPDGTFEFAGVLPGNYLLIANTPIGGTSTSITAVSGKDLTNVEFKTAPAREIPGRVVINDPAKPRIGFSVVVPNRPPTAPMQRFTAPTGPDGRFTLVLPEGENRLTFDANFVPPGFMLKSATYGSLDILTNPIKVAAGDTAELTLTFDASGVSPVSVSGRINGLKSATNARIALVANATNAAMDTAVNPDGTFTFPRVFPGQYQARFSFNSAQVQTGVTVGNTNKTDVFLNYGRDFQLTGQVVMDGLPVDTPPVPVTVEVRRADGVGAPITSRSTNVGVLRIMVPEGEMTFAVRDVPAGYQVKSFTYGDLDILKNPLKLDDPAIWTFVLKIGRQ